MYRHNLLPVSCMKVTKRIAGFSFTIFSIATNVTRCYAINKINIGLLLGPILCHISGFALILGSNTIEKIYNFKMYSLLKCVIQF
jgi:hypothetical protein